jgi:hypothetical protein
MLNTRNMYPISYQRIKQVSNCTINNYPKFSDNPDLSENYPGIIRGISSGIRISIEIFQMICGYFSEEKRIGINTINDNET